MNHLRSCQHAYYKLLNESIDTQFQMDVPTKSNVFEEHVPLRDIKYTIDSIKSNDPDKVKGGGVLYRINLYITKMLLSGKYPVTEEQITVFKELYAVLSSTLETAVSSGDVSIAKFITNTALTSGSKPRDEADIKDDTLRASPHLIDSYKEVLTKLDAIKATPNQLDTKQIDKDSYIPL